MKRLAGILSRQVNAPVLDKTGLEGTYDITLRISLDPSDDSLFKAVEKLGLKLAPRRVPAGILVIDKVEKPLIPY
jgi:uncharacterized protein (TIGR03435 family)